MKKLLNIFKFLVAFIIFLEVASQLISYKEGYIMYTLGVYPIAKTPSLEDWERIYDEKLNDETTLGVYDSIMGWAFRPHVQSNFFQVNAQGFRGVNDFKVEKDEGIIRIGLFGNSYMLSAEVSDSQTLRTSLESALIAKGYHVEVYNFSVFAYGNDQNYLSWKYNAQKYNLDIVVAGVHEFAFWCNHNIFSYNILPETSVSHLTKPKAILENNELKWVNLPALSPENVLNTIVLDYEQQSFYKYDFYNKNRRVGEQWFENLYLYQIGSFVERVNDANIDRFVEGQMLTDSIFRMFKNEVEATGNQFVLLELPIFMELIQAKLSGSIPHQEYLDNIAKNQNYFAPTPFLTTASNLIPYFEEGLHYSGKANKVIGDNFADYLINNNLLK